MRSAVGRIFILTVFISSSSVHVGGGRNVEKYSFAVQNDEEFKRQLLRHNSRL